MKLELPEQQDLRVLQEQRVSAEFLVNMVNGDFVAILENKVLLVQQVILVLREKLVLQEQLVLQESAILDVLDQLVLQELPEKLGLLARLEQLALLVQLGYLESKVGEVIAVFKERPVRRVLQEQLVKKVKWVKLALREQLEQREIPE